MNNEIISKLNVFIRKYYKNLLIKGLIYSVILLLVFFFVLNIIEFFGYNAPIVRTIIFYCYILLSFGIIGYFVVVPLFKLFSIGKTLSYVQAAKIIGNHFPQIQDKLLNLLQLQDISKDNDSELLKAAIEQKTIQLTPIPFTKAIDTNKTKKYFKILSIVVVSVLIVGILFPRLFSEPTNRYINHNVFFEKPAPFSFYVKNTPLKAIQQSDITIDVEVKGDMLPDKANIIIDGQEFEMKQINKSSYQYTIKQIQKTTKIQFVSGEVKSKEYDIQVNPKPILTELKAEIIYPSYTKIKNEIVNNVTNLSIPKGSRIVWHIRTKDASDLIFKSNNLITTITPDKKGNINFSKTYLTSQNILINTKNRYAYSFDSIQFAVSIIEDDSPQIAVIEQKDSTVVDKIYFRGQIKDDYGFTKLEYHLIITPKDNSSKPQTIVKRITITNNENAQEFYYYVDLTEYKINAGDKINYYFQVWDNDQINGSKSAKSQIFAVALPTEKEVEKKVDNNSQNIKKEADKAIDEIKKLQRQINQLSKKLVDKKELSWQDEKDIKDLQQKQEQIKEKVSQIQNKLEENNKLENQYNKQDNELIEKQQEIERLFNELQNNDLKELMQKLQELTKKNMDKDKLNDALKDIKDKNENLSKQLDKNLEMYKRLEVEKDINNAIDKLNELSKKQEQLSNETKNDKNSSNQTLQNKQEQLNKEFNDLKKKFNEIKQKDAQLETPFNFKKDANKENSITEKQNKAQKDIQKGNNKDASNNQKQASQQMKEMAQEMEKNQQENEQEQLAEDIGDVRQILKNLVTLSKQQESLIYQTQNTIVSDPAYQNIINKQNVIKESMASIGDSLYQISKRQRQVSNTINQEMSKVKTNIETSLSSLLKFNQSFYGSYKNSQATSSQQYAMASMNNLSLLLAESLDNMNQQQSQNKKQKGRASKQCKNPSSSGQTTSPRNMREMQQALNKEIQRLQKELQNKGNMSKHKIGENAQLNEELAKAAAQQAMIRKMMENYLNQLKQENAKGVGDANKSIKQMEDTEKDIVNKRINNQTINRQAEILTRMLESERADKKKGRDDERKSTVGVDKFDKNIQNIEAFKQLKNRELELFRQIPPIYSSYYKAKVNEYFYKFESSNNNKKH